MAGSAGVCVVERVHEAGAVLVAAPQRAGERLGGDLCDAFIQNAEGKGLGWPLFGRPVLP